MIAMPFPRCRDCLPGLCLLFLLIGLHGSAPAQEPKLVAETDPLTPQEQLTRFHLPPGFRVELIAAEPEIQKPINMNFDAAGRLYVTQSIEYPYPAPDDRPARDTIRIITDEDGDGTLETVAVFADGLNIPIGVTAGPGGVLGYSIPKLHFFADANGDGRADERRELYGTFGFRDTHGMVSSLNWWIDGWVYGCHGFANESEVRGADGEPVKMQSGNTYRLRPDGSRIEQYTHGQVNPFGMCFDPLGNVYTSDCHSRPAYLLLRGAYYPSFGKPHDGLGYGPELMQHSHGSTGIAGIVYYAADQFPPEYRDTLFIGNPITGKINHDRLEPHGSTYRAVEQPDFLHCDDPWFRPVDLQLAPDGSLYIADFYNRIIGHYEVPLDHPQRDRERGRIWRVSYVGENAADAQPTAAPDLMQASQDELIEALGSANLTLRTHATHQLVHRIGAEAVEPIHSGMADFTPEQRAHGLWVLARLDALDAETVRRSAGDADRIVRLHLLKVMAEQPDWSDKERQIALAGLQDHDPFVRRAAAEALGQHPHIENVVALLTRWNETPAEDAFLIHTVRMALRDTVRQLGNLPELAESYRDSAETLHRLAEISVGVPSAEAAEFLLIVAERDRAVLNPVQVRLHHIGRHAADDRLADFHQLALSYRTAREPAQLQAVRAAHRALQERGLTLPGPLREWGETLARRLLEGNEAEARTGLELARDLRLSAVTPEVVPFTAAAPSHPALRPLALEVTGLLDPAGALVPLDAVLASFGEPMALRQHAAQVLGNVNTPQARDVLVRQLRIAHSSLAHSIAAALGSSRDGADLLLAAIEAGAASPLLLQDQNVRQRLLHSGLPEVEARVELLSASVPPVDQQKRELMAARVAGFSQASPRLQNGPALFEKNCAACHRIGDKGTKVGPELDGVGSRGLDRLLEDLLDPSRNVDATFRASVVALNDGRVLNGLVLREEGEVLLLVDDQGKEQRIPIAEIEERKQLTLSPMPANVADKISEQEFYDLIGWLLEQRQPAKSE